MRNMERYGIFEEQNGEFIEKKRIGFLEGAKTDLVKGCIAIDFEKMEQIDWREYQRRYYE